MILKKRTKMRRRKIVTTSKFFRSRHNSVGFHSGMQCLGAPIPPIGTMCEKKAQFVHLPGTLTLPLKRESEQAEDVARRHPEHAALTR